MHLLIPLYSSRILMLLYSAQSLLGLAALLLAAPPLWLSCFCALAWLGEILRQVQRERPNGLVFSDSAVVLSFADRNIAVRVHRHCFCSRYLVILHLQETAILQGHRRPRQFSLVLLPDSCPASSHRQLRTALRWHSFDAQVLLP